MYGGCLLCPLYPLLILKHFLLNLRVAKTFCYVIFHDNFMAQCFFKLFAGCSRTLIVFPDCQHLVTLLVHVVLLVHLYLIQSSIFKTQDSSNNFPFLARDFICQIDNIDVCNLPEFALVFVRFFLVRRDQNTNQLLAVASCPFDVLLTKHFYRLAFIWFLTG